VFLEYTLQGRERLRVSSKPFQISNSKTYVANFEVIGDNVPDYSSYFVIHFLDKNNVEVGKKIKWLIKLSAQPRKFELIFKPILESSSIILGFTINDEHTFPANQTKN